MLEFLDAGCNSISFLPESISDLRNLKELVLGGLNRVTI